MRIAALVEALLAGSLAIASGIPARAPQQSAAPAVVREAPTFSRDVAPILYKHCASCHRRGEIAPMPLLTFEDVRPWARAIARKVAADAMPPWHADPKYGTWRNDRRLTSEEKATIALWVAADGPQGDPRDLPPRPPYVPGWNIGMPDAVFAMDEAFAVPARGEVRYQYFKVPTAFTEDKWVQALEIRPGNRTVVHHVLVYAWSPGTPPPTPYRALNPSPPAPVETTAAPGPFDRLLRQVRSTFRAETPRGTLIAQVAPGGTAHVFDPGTALRLRAGTILTFQIHYTANGTPAADRTSIGFTFAKGAPAHELFVVGMQNPRFEIPPMTADYPVESRLEFLEDVTLYSVLPHTHLRGRSWQYTLTYPDGRSEIVLAVPKYDFNWQTEYQFETPLHVPKGAILKSVAIYDNSPANKSNPDPTQLVLQGNQTWEEMQYTGLLYSINRESGATAVRRSR
jgi:hypothetical protein